MASIDIKTFPGPDELASAVSAAFLTLLERSAPRTFCVALSGGRIAATLFQTLAATPQAANRLNPVHFFWGDERCVPPDHPDSNFGLANRLLLHPLGISATRIHRIRGEDDPQTAARAASHELAGATASSAGQPVLDLVFLGMGEDGHVASLFPGEQEQTILDPSTYRPVTAPKPPPIRITLGYPALSVAREAWVLISGHGKKDSYIRSLQPGLSTPLARVLALRPKTVIWTDIPD